MRKIKLFAIMLLALALSCSVFAVAHADATATSNAAIGVIEAQMTFGNASNPVTLGGGGTLDASLVPDASMGGATTKITVASTNAYWTPDATVATAINPATELGVTYNATAKTSNLGVAFWLYVQDQATLGALEAATFQLWIGHSMSSRYITGGGKGGDYDLVVGWNELVFKHNIGWASGSPNIENGVSYIRLLIESMPKDVTRTLAVSDFRLVKTSQKVNAVLNRTEKEQTFATDGVIANALPYAELGATGVSNGAGGSVVSNLHPVANTEKSIKNTLPVGGNHYWSPYVNLATGNKPYNKLGVTYSDSASNLGVALWLYIEDEATLNALSNAVFDFYMGQSASARWITLSGTKVSNYALVVGWNELVFKQNIAWKTGTPNMAAGISYVSLGIRNMDTSVSRTLAINNIRLVRTTQSAGLVINHNEVAVKGTPATCTATGLTDGVKCTVCDKFVVAQTEIAAKGHSYTEVVTAPTCEAAGYTTHTCACGDTYTDSEVVAKGHAYDAGVVTTEPTCTEKGVKTFTCANDASHTYTEEVEATGHAYDEGVVTTEPTCTEKGVKTFTCANDASHTYTDEVAAKGHSYTEVVTDPTCEAAGYTTHTCACGDTYTDSEVAAKGHAYDEGVVTTEPTCTEKGVKTFTCANDASHTYTEEVEATGHTLVKVEAKEATATEAGNTEYYVCSVCGKYYADENGTTEIAEGSWEIPALGEIKGCIAGVGTASVAFSGLFVAVYTLLRKKRS